MKEKKARPTTGTKAGRGRKKWLSPKLVEHGNVERITRTMLRGGAPASTSFG